jgi:hypothetical protein
MLPDRKGVLKGPQRGHRGAAEEPRKDPRRAEEVAIGVLEGKINK